MAWFGGACRQGRHATVNISTDTYTRVRYAETDAMGIAHHASYIIWLELGRTDLLRVRGMPYRELEQRGFLVVLSDLQVRYYAAARYDDNILIRTALGNLRSRQLSFDYELRLADSNALLVTARTSHVVLDRETRRPVRLPQELLALFNR